jgi:putative ABC transport system substrate-binding protein
MRRRTFLSGATGVALASALPAKAQTSGPPIRIGRLSPLSAAAEEPMLEGLRRGLREHGWIEGRNFTFEIRTADARVDRLSGLAADLVRVPVDVIVTGSSAGALAAKNATSTIPIVMVTTGDPVAHGLVSSLARPGGNVTGVTALGQDLSAKRLELLKQILPDTTRIAVLTDPGSIYSAATLRSLERAAQALNVQIQAFSAHEPGEFERSFAEIRSARAEALMVLVDILFITHRGQIATLAAAERLPVIYGERESLSDRGLFFYGASLPEMYRRAAAYVDKILKGAKPADMPVEQPTQFELVLNLKTARALGIAIPQSVLVRADEVIE